MTDDRNQPQTPPGPQTPPDLQTPPGPWPPPIPDRPSGKGKAIGITAGALVFAGALVGGLLYFNDGSGDGAAAYRIEMPQTLVDGEYKRDKDEADDPASFSTKDRAEMKSFGIEDPDGDTAAYKNDRKEIRLVSVYGKIPDPRKTVAMMIAKMDRRDRDGKDPMGFELTTEPYRDYHPRGFDGAVLKCKNEKVSIPLGESKLTTSRSMCLWGDKGVVGLVLSSADPRPGEAVSGGLPADQLAEAVAKIRKETLVRQ
ncbi:hypothetical protein [Streptomyces nondiastaticus]|uniref:DUF3558 domain-containing protein n=1 Tax=Streptomyces nondiastaticus TaxID=3154512 RepID=A0ABW6TXI9_9ACTN